MDVGPTAKLGGDELPEDSPEFPLYRDQWAFWW